MSVTLSNLTATWSNTSVSYTAIKMNVANNGSASDSKLMDLQANGTSVFAVYANGYSTVTKSLTDYAQSITPATIYIPDNKHIFDLADGSAVNFNSTFDRRGKKLGGGTTIGTRPISFVGSSSSVGDGVNPNTLSMPSGLQEGDLVLVIRGYDAAQPDAIPESGWTSVVAGYDGNTVGYALDYKIMGSTPDTSVTVNNQTNAASIAVAYRGVDQTTPIEVTSSLVSQGTTQPNPPSITALTPGSEIVAIGWLDDDNVTITAPSGFDSNTLTFQSGTATGFTVMSASVPGPTVAFDPGLFTGGDDANEAITLALKPASGSTFTIEFPEDLLANDMVAMMVTGSLTVPALPTGWTNTGYTVTNTNTVGAIYYKFLDDPPESNVTLENQGAFTSASWVAFRNIDKDNPILTSTIGAAAQSNDPVPGAVTPSENHAVIFAGGYIEARSATANVTGSTNLGYYISSGNNAISDPFTTFVEAEAIDFGAAQAYNPPDLADGATTWSPGTGSTAWEWTVAFNTKAPKIEFANPPNNPNLIYSATITGEHYTDYVEWPENVVFTGTIPGGTGTTNGWPIFSNSSSSNYASYALYKPASEIIQYGTGQEVYTTVGTHEWVVPNGVYTISAVTVGGGGGGFLDAGGGGGGAGGDLRYSSNISVTPGETISILVGDAGTTGATPTKGGYTQISRSNGQVILIAAGGGEGQGPTSASNTKNGTSNIILSDLSSPGLTYTYYTIGTVTNPTTEETFAALFDTDTVSPTVTLGGTGTHTDVINYGDSGQTGPAGVVGSKPAYLPADQYAVMFEGYLLAPETGTYSFGFASDDGGDIFVNDVSVASFYGGRGITAAWTANSTINLVAGEYYTFRVRHQEGSGGDGMQVGWQKPSDGSLGLMPADYFYTSIPEGSVEPYIGGGNGGAGGAGASSGSSGGGGAGGYSGKGGDGAGSTNITGSTGVGGGGGGGGSGGTSNDASGAGGGVGLYGEGSSGAGGAGSTASATSGSPGSSGSGTLYGGGGGSSDNTGTIPTGAGRGAARIVWGRDTDGTTIRVYPSTATANANTRTYYDYMLLNTPTFGFPTSFY